MAANSLDVEPVADVDASSTPIDTVGAGTHASTIYQLQLAFMTARVASLERELECERAGRRRTIERYEQLLADRDAEIERLQAAQNDGLLATLRG
jgi:hypothetical protein